MTDLRDLELARRTLTTPEFDVWLAKHLAGYGRRTGSIALGITEDAWRHRLAAATRKIHEARKEAA